MQGNTAEANTPLETVCAEMDRRWTFPGRWDGSPANTSLGSDLLGQYQRKGRNNSFVVNYF